ncbi:hypothetical protein HDU76_009357 [Blyttiomyces sp. JEL0837]|nr:hypothetical protein HDU76_009357 [Blyttiomyces sp. JEL0837]
MDIFTEYGQISHGTVPGAMFEPDPKYKISDADLQAYLKDLLITNTIPNHDDYGNMYLPVHLGPQTILTDPPANLHISGNSACESTLQNWTSYHNFFWSNGHRYQYSVILECVHFQTLYIRDTFDSQKILASTVLANTITDPTLTSWYSDTTGNEAGTICFKDASSLVGGDACIHRPFPSQVKLTSVADSSFGLEIDGGVNNGRVQFWQGSGSNYFNLVLDTDSGIGSFQLVSTVNSDHCLGVDWTSDNKLGATVSCSNGNLSQVRSHWFLRDSNYTGSTVFYLELFNAPGSCFGLDPGSLASGAVPFAKLCTPTDLKNGGFLYHIA